MIEIDGSQGEGGGQILRTSLALSLITGKPFRISRIRAGREKPGLQRQHLTAVEAAATVGQAKVQGGEPGSLEMTFEPGQVKPGEYSFAIGTAGSTTLVLQTAALTQARRYLRSDAPVGEHLADQLLLPLAFAGGGTYRTTDLTAHCTTNIAVIKTFMDVVIVTQREDSGNYRVTVHAAAP